MGILGSVWWRDSMVRNPLLLLLVSLALVTAAPAAEANAEADPYLIYGGFPYPDYPYTGFPHGVVRYPFTTYTQEAVPDTASTKAVLGRKSEAPYVYSYQPYKISEGKPEISPFATFRQHFIAKREAEAEPRYLVYGGLPYSYGHNPYFTHTVVKPAETRAAGKKIVAVPVVYGAGYQPHNYLYDWGYQGYHG